MLNNPVILVCTDFGQESDHAMKSAENIRRRVGGKVHALHVSDFPLQRKWFAIEGDASVFSKDFEILHLKPLRQLLQEQVKRCELECTAEVVLDQTYNGINDAIEKLRPDLVIMGYKGRSFGPFHLGGTVTKIVASSTRPVLVIKKLLSSPLGKVAGLVSVSEQMKTIITATEEFSFLFSAAPLLVSIFKNISQDYYKFVSSIRPNTLGKCETQKPEPILAKMRELISSELDSHSKCQVRVELTQESHAANQLVEILEEEHVELAIMKRHKKEKIEKMLIGPEARRVLELFSGNILVLPPTA